MLPQDPTQTLHSVVHSYLTTLLALSEAVGDACPAIGLPHRQRLNRLRTRLSYDTSKEAVEQSVGLVREELRDFSSKTAAFTEASTHEWRKAAEEARSAIHSILKRQSFYATRLRECSHLIETAETPEALSAQTASMTRLIDSMTTESESLAACIDEVLRDAAARLEDMEAVDKTTGIMNRREMERRIAHFQDADQPIVRIRYGLAWTGKADSNAILRQAALRLGAQTRPEDLVARWGEHEFLVMFNGPLDVAARRGEEIATLVSGPYSIDGATVNVQAHAQCLEMGSAEEIVLDEV